MYIEKDGYYIFGKEGMTKKDRKKILKTCGKKGKYDDYRNNDIGIFF